MAEKPDKQVFNTLFGWCATGQHEHCRVQFNDWHNRVTSCSCKCHDK